MATSSLVISHSHDTTRDAYIAMGVAVLAWAFAGIFIRFAQLEGVPSFVIALGRFGLSALVLTPFVLRYHRADLRAIARRDWPFLLGAGFAMALQFGIGITSFQYTSVMIAAVFGAIAPLWVVILERIFFQRSPSRVVQIGIVLAVGGAVVVALGKSSGGDLGSLPLLGAALSSAAAGAAAVYMLVGRSAREHLPVVPYIWMVNGIAAICMAFMIGATSTSLTGYSTSGYFWVVLTMLLPHLIGHSAMNFALAYLSTIWIAVSSQLTVVLASILAVIILGERPGLLQLFGSMAILAGVFLVSFTSARKAQK